MLTGNRECNCAAPHADVQHTRLAELPNEVQCALDDDLRFGARNERACIDLERQPPKSPLPQDVRERLALPPALHQWLQAVRNRPVALRIDARPRDAKDMRNEELGVDARRVHPGRGEPLLGAAERFPDRHSPSARRRSSDVSAWVNSSSSPCCFSRSSSYSRERRTRNAFCRFCSWLFSSCIETTSPVGMCVMRTAESVVFTLCPPGPVER